MGSYKHPYLTKLFTLLLSSVAPIVGAGAQDYGKIGAVNVDATGTPPGGSARSLTVGGNILHKERILTSAKGSTQLLFPDQSTLNVGSNSNIVIDEFVYDPNARTGKMVASATKGVLRYIGGQISHTAGATINTPVASLGIRGGIATLMLPVPHDLAMTDPFLAQHQGQQLVIAHFGAITMTNNVSQVTIRPGFAAFVGSPNQPIGTPFRPSDAVLQLVMQSLTSNPGQHGGVGLANAPTGAMTQQGIAQGTLPAPGAGRAGIASGSNPPGADPLGYVSIFGSGSQGVRDRAQTPPPYP
jgi:hypothetical protein